jgi:hypothetical protein
MALLETQHGRVGPQFLEYISRPFVSDGTRFFRGWVNASGENYALW